MKMTDYFKGYTCVFRIGQFDLRIYAIHVINVWGRKQNTWENKYKHVHLCTQNKQQSIISVSCSQYVRLVNDLIIWSYTVSVM